MLLGLPFLGRWYQNPKTGGHSSPAPHLRLIVLEPMGFIHNEGIAFARILVHLLIDEREAVERTDDDA